MIKKIASLYVTLAALAGMIICLLWGWVMGFTQAFRPVIRSMNDQLIIDWLISNSSAHPTVAAWFILLCLASAVLFVNLAACIVDRLWPWSQNGGGMRRILLLASHVLFAVIMLGHAASFITGFKYDQIKLSDNGVMPLEQGYELRVEKVIYVDDPELLKLEHKKSKRVLTREAFNRYENGAIVAIFKDGVKMLSGKAMLLQPVQKGQVTVSLTGMYIDESVENPAPGGTFAVVKSPLNELFFGAYSLLIICMFGLLLAGWRKVNYD